MTEADLLSDIDPVLRRRDPNVSEATSPLTVYVAGPMRGIAEFNFPAFEKATAQLRSRGYKVVSPAEMDLGRGFEPTGLAGTEDLSDLGFDLRRALVNDLRHLAYECDAICLLPGWEDSKGATVELALAQALGLRIGTLEDYLDDGTMTEHEFLQGVLRDLWTPERLLEAHEEALGYEEVRCSNCDDRKCMDCVLRYQHDNCRDDCPDCCDVSDETADTLASDPALAALREKLTGNRFPDVPWVDRAALVVDQIGARLGVFDDDPAGRFQPSPPNLPTNVFKPVTSLERDNEVRVTSSTGGQKGKKLARFDLIPVRPWWDVAELYGYGTRKYEDRNWERGYNWSLSYAALQRHANLFWHCENDDPETGLPHLAAVVFHALALMEYARTHPEFDDRPGVTK